MSAVPFSARDALGRSGASRSRAWHWLLLLLLVAGCGGSDGPVAPTMSINITQATLNVDETVQLSAVNATGTVEWRSSNTAVATVVSTGFVTAVGAGSATVTASASGQTASAQITVRQRPAVELSSTALTFTARAGSSDPAGQTVAISNSGEGTLSGLELGEVRYGAGQPAGWLSASISGSTAPAQLSLNATVAGLIPGTYNATVDVQSPVASNTPRAITVTFTVTAPPTIELSQTTAEFTAVAGGSASAPVAINLTSGAPAQATGLAANITFNQSGVFGNWLTATLSGDETPATLTLAATTAALIPGTYSASVTLTSPDAANAPRTVLVTMTVTAPPLIAVNPASLAFSANVGGANPALQTVAITNAGGGTLTELSATVEYGSASGWLEATLNQSTAPATLTVRATTGALATGNYTATVRIASPSALISARIIPVTFTVAAGAIIAANPTSLNFSGALNVSPSAQQIALSNSGGGVLSGLAVSIDYSDGSGWLAANLNATTAPATITVQPSASGLAAGTYNATVRIASPAAGNSPLSVPVSYTVAQSPTIEISTTSRSFNMSTAVATAPTQTVAISNGGGGSLTGLAATVNYSSGAGGWLTATLDASTGPTTLRLEVARGTLGAGSYNAFVVVTSPVANNSPRMIAVSLLVTPAPSIGLSATSRVASVGQGNGASSLPSITVSNIGGGTLTGLGGTIEYVSGPRTGWLSAAINSATAPAVLSMSVNAGTSGSPLPLGTYTARINITSPVADNSPRVVNVTFTVSLSLVNSGVFNAINGSCSGCHNNFIAPNIGTPALFRSNMVGVPTVRRAGYPLASTYPTRIVAGNATLSYLTYQLAHSTGAYRMPTSGSPIALSVRNLIRDWINGGAHP